MFELSVLDVCGGPDCVCLTAWEKCPYSEFFWSVLPLIWTEYRKILRISPNSVRMWENTDQKNSGHWHFSRSVWLEVTNAASILVYDSEMLCNIKRLSKQLRLWKEGSQWQNMPMRSLNTEVTNPQLWVQLYFQRKNKKYIAQL